MQKMKFSKYKLPLIIYFLFAIALITGCADIENKNITIPSKTNQAIIVPHTIPIPSPVDEVCPVPTLFFNNSQEITNIHSRISVVEPGKYPSADKNLIPYGSIIYHSPRNITRIFDSSGRQILILNTSENPSYTKYFDYSGSGQVVAFGSGNITYFTIENHKAPPCFAISFYEPDSGEPILPKTPIG